MPKFSGFKGLLSKQNQENAEANKKLSDFQKKIADNMIIHKSKPAGEQKPRTFEPPKEDKEEDSDDGFDQVYEKKRRGKSRRREKGGRGGRGGFKQ